MAPSRQPKRFCQNTHRGAFHEACRKLGERLVAEGAVTLEQLRAETGPIANKNTATAPLTPAGSVEPIPDQGDDHE